MKYLSILGLSISMCACSVPGTGHILTEFRFEKHVSVIQHQPHHGRKELSVYEVPQPKKSLVIFPYFAFEDAGIEIIMDFTSSSLDWTVKNSTDETVKLRFDRLTCLGQQELAQVKAEARLFSMRQVIKSKSEPKIFDSLAHAVDIPANTTQIIDFIPKKASTLLLSCMRLRSNFDKVPDNIGDTMGQEILLSLPFERQNGSEGSYHIRLKVLEARGREVFS